MRGRKPLPKHLRVIQGNRGKRPIQPDAIQIEPSMPMPPPHLCDDAKVEWGRVAPMLYNLSVLTAADLAALTAYCQAWATFKQASEALNAMAANDKLTKGLLIKTTNGNAIQNPLLGIANKAASDMVRYAAEFGMTPSARARVHAAKEQNDPKAKGQDRRESYFDT